MNLDYNAIADAVAKLDSHGIYSDNVLQDLADAGFDTTKIPRFTTQETADSIEGRGLGGSLTTEARNDLVWGYVVSGVVCRTLFGNADGDAYFGRGSSHRANIAQIRKAGNS